VTTGRTVIEKKNTSRGHGDEVARRSPVRGNRRSSASSSTPPAATRCRRWRDGIRLPYPGRLLAVASQDVRWLYVYLALTFALILLLHRHSAS
jgi:hypothetical protein